MMMAGGRLRLLLLRRPAAPAAAAVVGIGIGMLECFYYGPSRST
jgi:hypothetical protein